MQDKYVRRRRAVLAVLVVVSLILLTAYFGEAENSPLHSVQRGIVEVFTPVQEGASKVLSPVRDLAGWVSSTLHAKSQNGQLRASNAKLTRELAQAGTAVTENAQLNRLLHLSNELDLSQYGPVYANQTTYNPEVWYESIKLDKGAGDGIAIGDPVLDGQGLIGDISSVGSNYSEVAELSSPGFGAGVKIIDASGKGGQGTLGPMIGNPTTLQVSFLQSSATVAVGDEVVTSGFSDTQNRTVTSLYPAGIPVGTVSNADANTLVEDNTVQVSPNVNLHNINQVEILTKVRL